MRGIGNSLVPCPCLTVHSNSPLLQRSYAPGDASLSGGSSGPLGGDVRRSDRIQVLRQICSFAAPSARPQPSAGGADATQHLAWRPVVDFAAWRKEGRLQGIDLAVECRVAYRALERMD